MQRRNTFTLLLILTIILLLNNCTSDTVRPSSSGSNANAAGVGNNSTGSREGIGPKDTGIGGTSEGNTNGAVKGNSNVEPTGINKNAGREANTNKP